MAVRDFGFFACVFSRLPAYQLCASRHLKNLVGPRSGATWWSKALFKPAF